jgi:hypothetical protein
MGRIWRRLISGSAISPKLTLRKSAPASPPQSGSAHISDLLEKSHFIEAKLASIERIVGRSKQVALVAKRNLDRHELWWQRHNALASEGLKQHQRCIKRQRAIQASRRIATLPLLPFTLIGLVLFHTCLRVRNNLVMLTKGVAWAAVADLGAARPINLDSRPRALTIRAGALICISVLTFAALAAALPSAGVSRQDAPDSSGGPVRDESRKAKLELMETANTGVTVVPKILRPVAPHPPQQIPLATGFGVTPVDLEPLQLADENVSSRMALATPLELEATGSSHTF